MSVCPCIFSLMCWFNPVSNFSKHFQNAYMCVCMYVSVRIGACGDLRLIMRIFLISLLLILWSKVSSVDPELMGTTNVGNQFALGISCLLAFWFLELYVGHLVYLAFIWANGIWSPVLTLRQQTLYPLSSLPSPILKYFSWVLQIL